MYKILVVMNTLDAHKKLLEGIHSDVCSVRYASQGSLSENDLADADMIIGNIAHALLRHCKTLKLLQLNSAGTDGYTEKGVLPAGALLANATGAYGIAIAEHAIASLLCLMKKLDRYRLNQADHTWKDEGPVTSVYSSDTLIVGLGDIGSEIAIRMNALGSRVTAIRRTAKDKPDYVKALYTMDDLFPCLREADIVAACLPGYAETKNVFDRKAFDAMKDGAYFLNVGRGTAVDTEALCDALESGKLAGAALDVVAP